MSKLTISVDRCKGCGLCVNTCPKKVLRLSATQMNARGFRPAELTDEAACISCAFCAIICPDTVIKVEKEERA